MPSRLRSRRGLVLAAAIVFAACAEKLPETHVMPLVGAERAYERAITERGLVPATEAVAASDAVILDPEPRARGEALAALRPGLVRAWEPAYAEISASGELGFTAGPYQVRDTGAGTVSYGHYVSVWRRDGEAWRLVVEANAPHPPPLDLPDRFTYGAHRVAAFSPAPATELTSLRAAEEALIASFAVAGRGLPALIAAAAPDLRYHPPGSFPVFGASAAQTALLANSEALSYAMRGAGIAQAGDLGYVYGDVTRRKTAASKPEVGGYLRIWRRAADGRWQVAVDLTATRPEVAPGTTSDPA